MKLEVGKRYVMRNGEVTGPLKRRDSYSFEDLRMTWRADGLWSSADVTGAYDIVAVYVESQPQQPLRWVENCVPDKPGIWAKQCGYTVHIYHRQQESNSWSEGTWCYLGPIPQILPPKKKVVERLWLERLSSSTQDGTVKTVFAEHWIADGETIQPPGDWIRTDRTREREI